MKKRQSRKTLINKLDKVFSEVVRGKGKCERCGNTDTLQTSHIYSRSYQCVRWDELNAHCLCAGCHWWWHKNPLEAKDFVLQTHGEEGVKELRKRTHHFSKPTDSDLEELFEKLKKKRDEQNN
jgi:hypothetical protein